MALFGASFSRSSGADPAYSEIIKTHLGCQVLQDSGGVDGGCGTNASMAGCAVLEMSVNTSNGELLTKQ